MNVTGGILILQIVTNVLFFESNEDEKTYLLEDIFNVSLKLKLTSMVMLSKLTPFAEQEVFLPLTIKMGVNLVCFKNHYLGVTHADLTQIDLEQFYFNFHVKL